MAYTGPSIVDYLSSTGKDSSFAARKLLAEKMGVPNYTGTGNQNTQLLTSLRNLLTKPEAPPQEQRTLQENPETQNGSRLLSDPDSNTDVATIVPPQPNPTTTPVSAPTKPADLFNKTLQEMLKAAQNNNNEDLMTKRNAIIQARFNAAREATPEELRVLSPQAQASLRNLDVSGLEDQLGGINTALQSREAKFKAEQDARQNTLDFLFKQQQFEAQQKQAEAEQRALEEKGNAPMEINGQLIQRQPDGSYKAVYSAPVETQLKNYPASVQEYEYAKENGFSGSFTDYQNEDANRKAQVAKITAGGLNSVQQSAAFKLADDYEKASGDYSKVVSNYNRVVASAKDPSPAGDLALVFSYMKTLDPTSVVREGEFATAANSGSVGDKIMNQYNKILNGERLTDSQRKDFVARAKSLYQSAVNQQKQIDKTFSERAEKFGIPSDYVIRSQGSFNDTTSNFQYTNLKEYKNSVSSAQFEKISKIIRDENLDETEALKLINKLSFNEPLSTGLNGSLKAQVEKKYPTGFDGGQCTTFLHDLVQFPRIGDGKLQKFRSVDKFGIPANQWRNDPQVGDVIVTGENPTNGHTAMINRILPDGRVQLTESNYNLDEKVTHNRIIPLNSPKIYGAIRGPLKIK